ncbi:hypothetical protein V8E53_012291 [Lactarius tabidus]
MRASLFATLLLAASVLAPALASPVGIRDGSGVAQRRAPLAARDPNPNKNNEDKKKVNVHGRQQSNEDRRSTKEPEDKGKIVVLQQNTTTTTRL